MIFGGMLGIKRGWRRIRSWRKAFWHVIFDRCRVSYSQFSEDIILYDFMAERLQDPSYRGFWVDIGAHDPVRYSNTKIFSDMGWCGINVDAMPEAIEKFKSCRKRDINLNVGVGSVDGELPYYMFPDHAINTFDKAIADKQPGLKGVRNIKMLTLEHVLDKYLPAGRHIDFLTIDAEGFDFKILQSNNWEKYRPDFVLVEVHGEDRAAILNSEIARYMDKTGYTFVAQSLLTMFFRRTRIGRKH